MLPDYPEITIDASQGERIRNGSIIQIEQELLQPWVRVFTADRALLA